MSYIMTVNGPIEPESLGATLIHEHLHMDVTPVLREHGYKAEHSGEFDCCVAAEARWNPGYNIKNYQMTDVEMIIDELQEYVACGGSGIVDATPRDLGRNPSALKRIADATGLHIIMGSGYYLEATHKRHIADWPESRITESLIEEVNSGADGTGIKPGLLGEIGTNCPATESELAVVRATAHAALQTGLTISVHLHPWGWEGRRVLDVLLGEGLPPGQILLNHLNTAVGDDAYQRHLLDKGVFLSYDLMGFDHSLLDAGRYPPSDDTVCEKIVVLAETGYRDQILVSHDIGVRTRLRRYGSWGYSHIHRHVVPLLTAKGLDDTDVRVILEENPRRVLTVKLK